MEPISARLFCFWVMACILAAGAIFGIDWRLSSTSGHVRAWKKGCVSPVSTSAKSDRLERNTTYRGQALLGAWCAPGYESHYLFLTPAFLNWKMFVFLSELLLSQRNGWSDSWGNYVFFSHIPLFLA